MRAKKIKVSIIIVIFIPILLLNLTCVVRDTTSTTVLPAASIEAIVPTDNSSFHLETINSPLASVTPHPLSSTPTLSAPINTQYILTAVLNYTQHHLKVNEQILYTNNSPEFLNDLILMVEPNRYQGVLILKGLSWEDKSPLEEFTLDGNQLKIPLQQPLPPGGQKSLKIDYELYLPSPVPSAYTRPVPFGYTARQTNLVDWYPFIPPYASGQGWLAHQAGYFGEHLVYESSDFQVNILIENFQPISPIELISPGSEGGVKLSMAASTSPSIEGDWYHYHFENARNFAWSVSHEYQVRSVDVGDITVYGYSFPLYERAGEAALDTTVESLKLFNQLFGNYPHQTLSVVQADFQDGMEYDGLFFLSNGFYNLYNGTYSDYLTAIASHETAHQWFFGLVGNDQALEPWLDESLCTYSERIFYENLHPEALEWWWAYRINYYAPRGLSLIHISEPTRPY